MMKRVFLVVFCFLWFGCVKQQLQEESGASQAPNIIFILADDQRDNSFGAMGHPFIKTPNVDKLINKGIRFSNTYVAEPVCSPSRVSLFTGVHERIHGVGFSSSYQLTDEQWESSYPALLRNNGYFTGFIGKFGVEYYSFHAPEKFDYWWGHDGWTKFLPKDFDEESTTPYHKAGNDIITPIMGEAIEDFLNKRDENNPFCLSVSLNVPHGTQTTSMYTDYKDWNKMGRKASDNPKLQGHPIYEKLYRNRDMKIPKETGASSTVWIPEAMMDQAKGRSATYPYNYGIETNREHHIRYYQTITGIDVIIGNMVKELEERGLADNTIIIYGSDHGLLMGDYGMGGKALLYDLASKIPFFIYDPRLPQAKQGKTVDKLVSSLDITATILDIANVDKPATMQGISLMPLVQGESRGWREELFLESLFTWRDNPFCEGIRTGKWKYIRMYDGVPSYQESDVDFSDRAPEFEQLFNLEDDPEEKINLIEKYGGSEILRELRDKCINHSIEMNKNRMLYKSQVNCQVKS